MELQYFIVRLQGTGKETGQELLYSARDQNDALRFLNSQEHSQFSGKEVLLFETSEAPVGKVDISRLLDTYGIAYDTVATRLLATKIGKKILFEDLATKRAFSAAVGGKPNDHKHPWTSRRK